MQSSNSSLPLSGFNVAAAAQLLKERRQVLFIMVASCVYHLLACFIHTHGFQIKTVHIGLLELMIYLSCLPLFFRFIPLGALGLFLLALVFLSFAGLFWGGIDFKAIRDLIIPVLFVSVGRNVKDKACVDKALWVLIAIVLAVGVFEWLFLSSFTNLFNVFSYYASTGSISESSAMYTGQKLQLNGFRPAGIGRTILPMVFGNHRISSVFLEPVSLGNFAVIIAAWGMSKPWQEKKKMFAFLAASAMMIALADSRFGTMMILFLLLIRFFPVSLDKIFIGFPFVCLLVICAMAAAFPHVTGDNFSSRLIHSGLSLLQFDIPMLFGLTGPAINFGDMGYAYVLSRFGLLLASLLWFSIWLLPIHSDSGRRFRVCLCVYSCLILTVSGTSLFALKTAGLAWLLLGCVVDARNVHTASRNMAS